MDVNSNYRQSQLSALTFWYAVAYEVKLSFSPRGRGGWTGKREGVWTLTGYCPFMRMPIIDMGGADNWFVPIIGILR